MLVRVIFHFIVE